MQEKAANAKKLVLCDCAKSQSIEADKLADATGLSVTKVHTALCTEEADVAARLMAESGCIFACGQEQKFFDEIADETDAPAPEYVDIRDRAGWHGGAGTATAKMAALIAEAQLPFAPTKTVDVVSSGLCLVIGTGDVAISAATQLQDILGVTLLLTDDSDVPSDRAFDAIRGQLRSSSGALGDFRLTIDALQQVVPGGRGAFSLSAPRDGAKTECDVILDLSGDTALFPAPDKREGYVRADPGSAAAVSSAVFEAAQLIGTFEKPLYVRVEPILCAHSRADQTGCNKCLDNCPTSAIRSAGDHVVIDPMVCAGCGSCAALCPSGAISYDAPPTEHLFDRVQTLARVFLAAGGEKPRLLVVDAHGGEMIRLAARFGRGLPVDVIPLELDALNTFGHAEALAALAAGFSQVCVLPGPSAERAALEGEIDLSKAISGAAFVTILDIDDPEMLSEYLYQSVELSSVATPVRPRGTRRQITRQATKALLPDIEKIALPDGAPYGAVLVDTAACTLCLSCVSLCPAGALGDNEDLPQLRFQEDACLQCGLCSSICPEDAITYEPRLNLADQALEQVVLNEEEPFACVECGALFGSKSTVDRITEKLAGHSMYQNEGALRVIQMCDDCRVNEQFKNRNNELAGGERPRPRTTEDYLSKRRDH